MSSDPTRSLVCVIGGFNGPGYDHDRFIGELRQAVGQDAFPWTGRELISSPGSALHPYVLDEHADRIVEAYGDNEAGREALLAVWYCFDTFSAADRLYMKLLVRLPRACLQDLCSDQVVQRALCTIHSHQPFAGAGKIKLDASPKAGTGDSTGVATKVWSKLIVERKPGEEKITTHILMGNRGDREKVHIFSRIGESPTYEVSPTHRSPKTLPFRQATGVIVKDSQTYAYHVDENTAPNRKPSDG